MFDCKKKPLFALVLTVTWFILSNWVACESAQAQGDTEQQRAGLLGVNDWISIQISGQSDATSYVGGDGTVNVPLVGNVPVAGMSTTQAAARISKALKDGGFFVDPRVTVLATQPPGQFVAVVGEVQAQGRYPITPRTTLVELLAQAGGIKETASDVGYVLRKDAAGNVSRITVNLNMLKDIQDTSSSLTLLAGDSLLVPRASQFSIVGEVTTPGRYRMDIGMTVMQAIARAGGITERGSERRIQLRRAGDKPGKYQTINAKLSDVVKADDIIRVKESLF